MPVVLGGGEFGDFSGFATDRDLLAYEPRVFNEVSWSGQRVLDVSGAATIDSLGTTLTVTGARFTDLNVDAGWVVLVNDSPLEVTGRNNQTQLSISKPRISLDADAIPATAGTGLSCRVSTFNPQLAVAHGVVMRSFGIEPGQTDADGVGEGNVTNAAAVGQVELLWALQMIYASAAAVVGPGSVMWSKARMYLQRFAQARQRLVVQIDADGDGVTDATRRSGQSQWWMTRE